MVQKLARNFNYIVLNLSKFDKTKNLKKKFFCDCNVYPCYCLSNGKFENKSYNDFTEYLVQNNKKITKNQSKKNYEYLINQWLF
jgi:hypothetical protein|uniref:Uncharacterized protein n=1 Tax=viral metagenome TaxID=1070528 RepID=A0A6C0JRJ6_9ZZZZ